MQAVADQPPGGEGDPQRRDPARQAPRSCSASSTTSGATASASSSTLRSLESLIPSTWQQYIKAGSSFDYEIAAARHDARIGQHQRDAVVLEGNNHGRLVERWSKAVGADRAAVAVIEGGDRRSIYDLFEDIIGLRRYACSRCRRPTARCSPTRSSCCGE
ncbi:MAG: hypothetical protein WKF58_01940 [Ilumatobacteraceae bacterium]